MKRLMLGAVVAIAMACAGPAFAASPGGQSYDKEAKALVIAPAATAEVGAGHTPAAPVSAKLDVIDKVNLAAEKRAGKPADRSRTGKGTSTQASQRSEPLLL